MRVVVVVEMEAKRGGVVVETTREPMIETSIPYPRTHLQPDELEIEVGKDG